MQNQRTHTQADRTPLVSFVITYYNLPVALLCTCIDSVLALPLQPDEREIIVVDDGSDYSPLGELIAYGDSITYIHRENGGLSRARNTGIEAASGHYLQFIDGDDSFIVTHYAHCLDIIRRSAPDMVLFDFTDRPTATLHYHDSAPMSGAAFMSSRNIRGTACGYLFRKALLGGLAFTPDSYHEDEEFTPQLLLRAETVIATDAPAYLYRKRPSSIMTHTAVRHRLKRLNDMQLILGRLHALGVTLSADDRTALERRLNQLTMDYIYNIIALTRSRGCLDRRLSALQRMGLFPLPDRGYTYKYSWFRRLTGTGIGRRLLLFLIPLIKKER